MLPSPDKTSGSAVKDRVAGFFLHAVCARLAGGRANSPNSFAIGAQLAPPGAPRAEHQRAEPKDAAERALLRNCPHPSGGSGFVFALA